MPLYDFHNEETGEIFEMQMSIADKEKYLKKNKHIKQVVTKMSIGDSVRLGITKPPADFQKGIIGRMREKIHGNSLGRSKFNIPREW